MRIGSWSRSGCACGLLLASFSNSAGAQVFEAVGSRALGMGGAFVAVANDSSATWWNPAGLADGPFLDFVALARATTEITEELPARRDRATWIASGTPPIGFSYYHLKITDVRPFDPTGGADPNREDRRAGVPVRSLGVSQLGATLLQTLLTGIHVGTTLKYVRGTLRTGREDGLLPPSELLDRGEDYEGGEAENHFDLDLGALVITGPVRLGITGRNITEPEFAEGVFRLPRQVRAGAAFDVARAGGVPLTVAVDVDAMTYETASGDRRVVAVGGEQWLFARRLGIRAGARFNRVGAEDRTGTAGLSVSPRSGSYIDGHVVWGGSSGESGWGVAARVSF